MPLSASDEQWYIDRIQTLDPAGKVVGVDSSSRLLLYSSDIKTDESNARKFDPEEFVHALAIVTLNGKDYGYKLDSMYHEQYFKHGSVGSLSDEVDLIIYDEDGLPYAVWEFKSAEKWDCDEEKAIEYQLFGTAPLIGSPKLLVYSTINCTGSNAQLSLKCIDYTLYKTYDSWNDAGRPHSTDFPVDYQDLDYKPFVNGGKKELDENCTQADFRAIATGFHNEFFGEHPDNALFINLMKCLLAKIYDERTTKKGQQYSFQVRYQNGRPERASKVFATINTLYKDAYTRYIDSSGKPDEIDPKEFSKEHVKIVVNALESMSITRGASLHGDVIGAFFEEILRVGFKQDKGMFFTHANLVRFIVEAIDLNGLTEKTWTEATHPENRLPYIIDPASGSGAFLLQSMQTVTRCIRDNKDDLVSDADSDEFFQARMGDSKPNYWAENFLYGGDPKFIMAITAKVNMVLHGDGSAHIFKQDAFKPLSSYKDPKFRPLGGSSRSISKSAYDKEVCETFDAVVSNPPFGVTLSADTKKTLGSTFILPKSMPSEALFIERCFQLLKPGGRMGIVLPESIFNSVELLPARLFLYRMFSVKAVVSMPRNIFIDTPTLTSLLFAQKKSPKEIEDWDTCFNQVHDEGGVAVAEANRLLSAKAVKKFKSKEALEKAVLGKIVKYIEHDGWALKKGANSEVIPFTLKEEVTSVEEAAEQYKYLLKSPALKRMLQCYAFGVTAKKFDYDFGTCSVDEIGYKLSKRKEKRKPNQLCRFVGKITGEDEVNLHLCEEPYEVLVDTDNPSNVLDYIKQKVRWS